MIDILFTFISIGMAIALVVGEFVIVRKRDRKDDDLAKQIEWIQARRASKGERR